MFLLNKSIWLCALALLVYGHVAYAAEGLFPKPTVMAAPAKPTKAPDFNFANLHGGTLKSADTKGKVVVIRFWATW